jgi:hypothetical protein
MAFENNNSRKIPDFIRHLESQCRGLENFVCRNAIGMISKKIDIMEKKLDEDNRKKELRRKENNKSDMETLRIEALNKNFDAIESGFSKDAVLPGISPDDVIFRKIEENYKLLDELERSNRPIFSIKNENMNKVYIEDKIHEMDSRLGTLFSSYRKKCKSAGIKSDFEIHRESNEFIRDISRLNENDNNIEGFDKAKQVRLKELHDKLATTEKKIKEIAGTILKNF